MWFGARACTPACQVSVMCLAPVKDIYFIQAVHRQLRAVCRSTHTWDTNLHVLLLSSDAVTRCCSQAVKHRVSAACCGEMELTFGLRLTTPAWSGCNAVDRFGQWAINCQLQTCDLHLPLESTTAVTSTPSVFSFFERETTNFHSTTRPAQSLVTTNFL